MCNCICVPVFCARGRELEGLNARAWTCLPACVRVCVCVCVSGHPCVSLCVCVSACLPLLLCASSSPWPQPAISEVTAQKLLLKYVPWWNTWYVAWSWLPLAYTPGLVSTRVGGSPHPGALTTVLHARLGHTLNRTRFLLDQAEQEVKHLTRGQHSTRSARGIMGKLRSAQVFDGEFGGLPYLPQTDTRQAITLSSPAFQAGFSLDMVSQTSDSMFTFTCETHWELDDKLEQLEVHVGCLNMWSIVQGALGACSTSCRKLSSSPAQRMQPW